MMAGVETIVRDHPEAHRYELLVDGVLVGIADYHPVPGGIAVPHTEIDAARRGNGLGEVLVRGMLDDLRGSGLTVVPQCWFVRQFAHDHPEYADLFALD